MRRKSAPKREILPDPKYGDLVLAKFVNIFNVRRQEISC